MARFVGTFAALAAFGLTGCMHLPRTKAVSDLDDLLRFKAPARCEAGPALDALIRSLLRDTTKRPVVSGPPVVPERFRSAISELRVAENPADQFNATLQLKGRWLGLPVESLSRRAYLGGDGGGFSITVKASRLQALSAFSRAGFAIPAKGERPIADPRGGETFAISLTADGGRSTLHCDLND